MIPTPTVFGNNNRKGISAKSGDGLATFAKRKSVYPSPLARDCNGGTARPHGWGTQSNLNDFVLRWPTPMASDGTKYRLRGDSQASNCLASIVRFDTPAVHGDGGSGRNGAMPRFGQLNPDWEEWLMFWPVGWTDLDCPDSRLVWLDPSHDPACLDRSDANYIPRLTNRRENRPARVKEIGNGQFPLTAYIAFGWGKTVLSVEYFNPLPAGAGSRRPSSPDTSLKGHRVAAF